jgi:hypothetical protein
VSISEKFGELTERVESADRDSRAAAAEDQAKLQATLDKARKSADDRATDLRAKGKEASDKSERQWDKAQEDWDEHVKRVRARIDARKTDLDVAAAEEDAYDAEVNALDAIDFAKSAIAEAEYAVLDGLRAEKQAEAPKQASANPTI